MKPDDQGKVMRGVKKNSADSELLKADLKRVAEELELFRFLTENAAGEIYLVKNNMGIAYVNKAVCKSLGYKAKELYERKLTDFDIEFNAKLWKKFIDDLKRLKRPHTIETRHADKNGEIMIKEVTSLLVNYQGEEYVLGVAKDITERKQAEEALRDSEERFRLIFELARDGILVISPRDRIILWNREASRLFGYTEEGLMDMPVHDLFPRPQEIQRIKERLRRHQTLRNLEMEAQRKDGSTLPVAVTLWVERDQKRKVRCTYATIRDISEAKLLEQEKLEREKLYSMKILLKETEREKNELEERIMQNITTLLLPTLEKLKRQDLPEITTSYLLLLEENLKKISSPLLKQLSSFYQKFSPREIEVAELIRKGESSKGIGEVLCISPSAVNFHRLNIRRKLGIKANEQNLQVFLKSFS